MLNSNALKPLLRTLQTESVLRLMLRYLGEMLDEQEATKGAVKEGNSDDGPVDGGSSVEGGAKGGEVEAADNISQVTEGS
jgi:hypothetical protein